MRKVCYAKKSAISFIFIYFLFCSTTEKSIYTHIVLLENRFFFCLLNKKYLKFSFSSNFILFPFFFLLLVVGTGCINITLQYIFWHPSFLVFLLTKNITFHFFFGTHFVWMMSKFKIIQQRTKTYLLCTCGFQFKL